MKNIPVFATLEDKVLSEIAKLGSKKNFNKDSVILFQNQSDSALIIVLSGKLRLTKMSNEGNEVTLDILKESDFWGDTAIMDGKPPSVNIVAEENSEVYIITRTDLMNLFKSKPEYSIAVLNDLTKQLRASSLKIKSLSLKAAEGKVASVLIQLVDEYGIVKEGAIEIERLPTQQELANMAGTSRETISRTIHSFSKKGLIEIEGQKLRIKNYEKFKELNH
ncbi:MAG: Crp/Fnr family transcriptional regulator [Ignavibacteriaceae bacterium]